MLPRKTTYSRSIDLPEILTFNKATILLALVAFILLAVLEAQSTPVPQGVKGLEIPPSPNGEPAVDILADVFGFGGCDANQKQTILRAFGDAITIATAVSPKTWRDIDSFQSDDADIKTWFGKNEGDETQFTHIKGMYSVEYSSLVTDADYWL